MKKEIKSALPISLKSIEIENYAGIKKTGLKDLPSDAQWIFLTGENGFGKTSVLQAIAKAIYNDGIILSEQTSNDYKLTAVTRWSESVNVISHGTGTPAFHKLAAYGVSRLEITHDTSSNEAADKSGNLYSLFRSDGVLLSIEAEMRVWEKRSSFYFNRLRNTLLKVLEKNIGDIIIDEDDDAKVKYVELDSEGGKLPPVTFNHLASGYRSIIAMIGDLLIRFYKDYPKSVEPEEFSGIVLIDELDVHLHPKMQRRIPSILSGVFPKIQFVASIHSPIPILGAPENAVFLKVLRTREEGITLHNLDTVQVRSLTPDTLLSSPIFDFDEIIGDHHDKGKGKLVTEANYDEAMFSQMLEAKIREKAVAANIDTSFLKTKNR
jgi:predicted ATP-binding protein involved in virulence